MFSSLCIHGKLKSTQCCDCVSNDLKLKRKSVSVRVKLTRCLNALTIQTTCGGDSKRRHPRLNLFCLPQKKNILEM